MEYDPLESALDKQLAVDLAANEAARNEVNNPNILNEFPNEFDEPNVEVEATTTTEVQEQIDETKTEIEEAVASGDKTAEELADMQRRLDAQYRQKRKLNEDNRRLQQEIAVLRGERTETRDETIEREVANRLDAKTAEKSLRDRGVEIAEKGNKEYRDFESTISNLNEGVMGGSGLGPLTQIISDASPGNEHKILHFLGKNPTIAEDVIDQFNISTVKGVLALNKIVDKATKTAPVVSQAAPPINRVQTRTTGASTDNQTIDEFMARRDKEDHERYKQRGY